MVKALGDRARPQHCVAASHRKIDVTQQIVRCQIASEISTMRCAASQIFTMRRRNAVLWPRPQVTTAKNKLRSRLKLVTDQDIYKRKASQVVYTCSSRYEFTVRDNLAAKLNRYPILKYIFEINPFGIAANSKLFSADTKRTFPIDTSRIKAELFWVSIFCRIERFADRTKCVQLLKLQADRAPVLSTHPEATCQKGTHCACAHHLTTLTF